jgi:hypothetical protein
MAGDANPARARFIVEGWLIREVDGYGTPFAAIGATKGR